MAVTIKPPIIERDNHCNYFQLLYAFVLRESKVRYASSFLGSLWIILSPLTLSLTSTLIFSFIFNHDINNVPYFIFVMLSMTAWSFFQNTTIQSTRSLVSNSMLLTGTYFPKEVLVFSTIISKSSDFFINLMIVIIMALIIRLPLHPQNMPIFILFFIVQLLYQSSLSLILSSLNVYYRDIQNILNLLMQMMFIASPILYPLQAMPPKVQVILKFNPFVTIIESYRELLLFNNFAWDSTKIITIIVTIILFFAAITFFRKLERKFADVV